MDTCTKVFLRRKEISGGRLSLYLDFYPSIRNPHTNRLSRREGLCIYLYANPQSAREREFNASMEEKMRMDFLDYFRKKCYKKHQKWKVVYEHFSDFCRGKCLLGEVTEDFCKRFQKYLLEGGRRDDRKGTLAHSPTTRLPATGQHSVPF